MLTVYKYTLALKTGIQTIDLPTSARVIKAGIIRKQLCIWAQVDKDDTEVFSERFCIVGTGWEMEDDDYYEYDHIDSILDDPYIWHVFHLIPRR